MVEEVNDLCEFGAEVALSISDDEALRTSELVQLKARRAKSAP